MRRPGVYGFRGLTTASDGGAQESEFGNAQGIQRAIVWHSGGDLFWANDDGVIASR